MSLIDFETWLDDKIMENLPRPYKSNGKDINFRCPICGDSHKSKSKMRGHYYKRTHSFYCFNCDASLTGIKLLEVLAGSNFDSLKKEYLKLKYNNQNQNISVNPLSINNDNQEFSFSNLKNIINSSWRNPLSDKAKEYLDKRLIFKSPFSKSLRLYSTYNKNNEEYILIPWQLNGIDAYFQLNDFQKIHNKKYIFPPSLNKLIYGLDNIDINFKYIICFEGVYDSLFVKNGVAIGGKKLTNFQKQILQKRYPHHQIVMALDNDKAGKDATLASINRNEHVKYFNWVSILHPTEKDINDYVISHNNPNIFADENLILKCIVNPTILKYTLALSSY